MLLSFQIISGSCLLSLSPSLPFAHIYTVVVGWHSHWRWWRCYSHQAIASLLCPRCFFIFSGRCCCWAVCCHVQIRNNPNARAALYSTNNNSEKRRRKILFSQPNLICDEIFIMIASFCVDHFYLWRLMKTGEKKDSRMPAHTLCIGHTKSFCAFPSNQPTQQ